MGFFNLGRRAFLGLVLASLSLVSVGTATAATEAETFVQGLVDRGVAILRNTSDPDRRAKFREFIVQHADVRKTALFTLGNYRRQTSDGDVDAFVQAFKEYATAVYEARLDQYKGQTLKVVGSLENKPGDITVNTVIVDPNARQPLRVAFRLNGGNGSYRFFDIQVEGIWLSVDQKEQFASFLSKNSGSVPALTAHLAQQARQMASR